LSDAESLASAALAPTRWGTLGGAAVDHGDPHPTLARAAPECRDRARLPGPLQVLSGADGRAFSHGGPLCGAECAAGKAREASGRLAVGESVAARTGRSQADHVAECLAGRAATKLGGAGDSSGDGGRVGGVARECATREAVWRRRLGAPDGQAIRHGSDVAATRPA